MNPMTKWLSAREIEQAMREEQQQDFAEQFALNRAVHEAYCKLGREAARKEFREACGQPEPEPQRPCKFPYCQCSIFGCCEL